MESGEITDQQLSTSSEYNSRHSVLSGRLNVKYEAGAWCAGTHDDNQWLQVDLLSRHRITGVATQGRAGNHGQWVTKYRLQYSDNGVNFQYYREHGQTTQKVRLGRVIDNFLLRNIRREMIDFTLTNLCFNVSWVERAESNQNEI